MRMRRISRKLDCVLHLVGFFMEMAATHPCQCPFYLAYICPMPIELQEASGLTVLTDQVWLFWKGTCRLLAKVQSSTWWLMKCQIFTSSSSQFKVECNIVCNPSDCSVFLEIQMFSLPGLISSSWNLPLRKCPGLWGRRPSTLSWWYEEGRRREESRWALPDIIWSLRWCALSSCSWYDLINCDDASCSWMDLWTIYLPRWCS